MTATWFSFDESHGGIQPVSKPRQPTRRRWNERTMESVLGLNPELVGAGECLPVFLHGGQSGADQTYIDELGRLTIIEIKSREASERDLVQAMAYAYHGAAQSLHDLARASEACARRAPLEYGARVLAATRPELNDVAISALEFDKLSSLEAKVESIASQVGKPGIRKLGDAARRRLDPQAVREGALESIGTAVWGEHAFDLVGAPPRVVLVAPAFSEGCADLANELVERWVNLHLVRMDLYTDEKRGKVLVEREDAIKSRPNMDLVWRALAGIWRDPLVRKSYRPGAWYMYRPKEGRDNLAMLDLSSKEAPGAEYTLSACEDLSEGSVSLRVRHSLYEDAKKRAAFRKELASKLPKGRDGDDLAWTFALPKKHDQWVECATAVAKVAAEVMRDP